MRPARRHGACLTRGLLQLTLPQPGWGAAPVQKLRIGVLVMPWLSEAERRSAALSIKKRAEVAQLREAFD
jgi:hypothetical protein